MANGNKQKRRATDASIRFSYLSSTNPGPANMDVSWDSSGIIRSRGIHVQIVYRAPVVDIYKL